MLNVGSGILADRLDHVFHPLAIYVMSYRSCPLFFLENHFGQLESVQITLPTPVYPK